jgi:hypothetical protein
MTVPDGTSPITRMNRLLRVAAEFGIFVTIRRVPGGLLFWRSTDEDFEQAKANRVIIFVTSMASQADLVQQRTSLAAPTL